MIFFLGIDWQFFIEKHLLKIKKLKDLITIKGATTLIEVDDVVTNKNTIQLVKAETDVLVVGRFVLKPKIQ